tara:strand:+ start:138 stop:431 length:294 start_codon:yes stop_codon:yes gene_type:complete
MKESDDEIRIQIDALIRDEIQDNINQYVDSQKDSKEGGLGFVGKEDEEQLQVNIPQSEVEKILKEYKRIKKSQKSNLGQVKKLDLVDKNGRPLDGQD